MSNRGSPILALPSLSAKDRFAGRWLRSPEARCAGHLQWSIRPICLAC